MKHVSKFFVAAVIMAAFSVNVFSQATATATATIISPIAISKTTDMNFGNVAVNATPGTVVLTPAGGRSSTGGVTLPTAAGTVAAAVFGVTGQASATYTITLPSTDHTITDGTNNMIVNTFTSNPSGTGTLDGSGNQTLNVGATLNVVGGQTPGIYTSATPFTVTVNYN